MHGEVVQSIQNSAYGEVVQSIQNSARQNRLVNVMLTSASVHFTTSETKWWYFNLNHSFPIFLIHSKCTPAEEEGQ